MLDSGHCWRGALQPRGLRAATGWEPAAPTPPLGTASAASSCLAVRGAAPRGCSRTSSTHPLAPASIPAQRPFGAVGSTTAPSNFIPPLCSVVFSVTPSTALHTACPAWRTHLAAKLLPVSPQKGCDLCDTDAGCCMWDTSLQSLPSSGSRRDCCPFVQWQGVHTSPT